MTTKRSLGSLVNADEPSALEQKIEQLERQLETERDCRREDRFLALIIILILLDITLLSTVQNMAVPLIAFVMQIVFLFVLAKRMGVEQIAGILDRMVDHFAKKTG